MSDELDPGRLTGVCPQCKGPNGTMVDFVICGKCWALGATWPAPWKMTKAGLVDANGTVVLGINLIRSRAVFEVIVCAPEMEAMLRHVASEVLPMEYGRPDGKPGGIAEAAQEIIDRIDAAKGG